MGLSVSYPLKPHGDISSRSEGRILLGAFLGVVHWIGNHLSLLTLVPLGAVGSDGLILGKCHLLHHPDGAF